MNEWNDFRLKFTYFHFRFGLAHLLFSSVLQDCLMFSMAHILCPILCIKDCHFRNCGFKNQVAKHDAERPQLPPFLPSTPFSVCALLPSTAFLTPAPHVQNSTPPFSNCGETLVTFSHQSDFAWSNTTGARSGSIISSISAPSMAVNHAWYLSSWIGMSQHQALLFSVWNPWIWLFIFTYLF